MFVYKIESKSQPEKKYVGSTKQGKKRFGEHKAKLKRGVHENPRLQNHANKYGVEDFIFEILEPVMFVDDILNVEQKYMDKINPYFNIKPKAHSVYSVTQSEETKRKRVKSKMITMAKQGGYSDDTIMLMSEAAKKRYKPKSTDNWQLIKPYAKDLGNRRYKHLYKCTKCESESLIARYRIEVAKCKTCSNNAKQYQISEKEKRANIYGNNIKYNTWEQKRTKMCIEWKDFNIFDRDTTITNDEYNKIYPIDESKPIAKDNYIWSNNNEMYYLKLMKKGGTSKGTSGYAGINWDSITNEWRSRVKIKGKLKDVGRYDCKHEAYRVRIEYMIANKLIRREALKVIL